MDARFVSENALADQALLPAHLPARSLCYPLGDARQPAEVDAGLDAVKQLEANGNLFQRRVPRALAQPVHRRVDVRRAGNRGRQTVRRRHAQIVVGMHLQLQRS